MINLATCTACLHHSAKLGWALGCGKHERSASACHRRLLLPAFAARFAGLSPIPNPKASSEHSAGAWAQIDARMMSELREVQAAIQPSDTLLVVDAMTGQEAAGLVKSFNEAAEITGAPPALSLGRCIHRLRPHAFTTSSS